MVSIKKGSTPSAIDDQSNHPADKLSSFIDKESILQLQRTPPRLLIEDPVYETRLSEIRNSIDYCYLIQWLYLFRSLFKLTNEGFDAENFEEEILGIASPIFLNKFKIGLIQLLTNHKIIVNSEIDFEFNEMIKNVLSSNELFLTENENGELITDEYKLETFNYNTLPLVEQLQILSLLVKKCNVKNDNIRKLVDKYNKPHEDTRLNPVFEKILNKAKTITKEQYFVLEDCRLYYKKTEFGEFKIPKNRTEFNKKIKDTATYFNDCEPTISEFKILTCGIYEFDSYLNELKKKAGKKLTSDEYKLLTELKPFIEKILNHDLKKRKQASQRKREIQMQSLLANRKRSSRLEEKEKRRLEEEKERLELEEQYKLEAASIRAAKRMKLKDDMYGSSESSTRASSIGARGDRARARSRQYEEVEEEKPVVSNEGNNEGEEEEEANWMFDCLCGLKHQNYDDGTKLISCEVCDRWQHYNCQPDDIKEQLEKNENESSDNKFVFKCSYCRDSISTDVKQENGQLEISEPIVIEETETVTTIDGEKDAQHSAETDIKTEPTVPETHSEVVAPEVVAPEAVAPEVVAPETSTTQPETTTNAETSEHESVSAVAV
ncbi:hypothetical protein B5S31_g3554 [[Candida] boidinii]|nr:hypothetical protein B5S31_g3554 [[Candida] boidinii]